MSAFAPGTVIDGTPEELETVLLKAPPMTLILCCRDNVWRKLYDSSWLGPAGWTQLSNSMILSAPLTVLRWGSEFTTPAGSSD